MGIAGALPARRGRFSTLITLCTWLMIILMVVPGGLDYSAMADAPDVGNPVSRALWIAILAASVTVILSAPAATLRLLRQLNLFYLLFIALALASVAWSIDPALTARRLMRLMTMFTAFVAVAVSAWQPHRYQQMIRPALTLMLGGSLIFGWLRPDLAIQQETSFELLGAWHGLATQKNEFGALASFGCVFWLHALLTKEAKWPATLAGLAIAGACLILSRSTTSLMATLFASAFLLLLLKSMPGWARRTMPLLITILTVLLLTYSITILRLIPGLEILLRPIAMITGKDLTFTGRAEIWDAVTDHIQLRPLLGGGYGAFWGGPTPDSQAYGLMQSLYGFYPGSAHNAYLDILNDLGAVGLLCLLGYLVVYLRQSLRLFMIDRAQAGLYLALFLQQSITNLSETHWLNVTSLDFVLLSMATTHMARALREMRPRGARARQTSVSRLAPRIPRR